MLTASRRSCRRQPEEQRPLADTRCRRWQQAAPQRPRHQTSGAKHNEQVASTCDAEPRRVHERQLRHALPIQKKGSCCGLAAGPTVAASTAASPSIAAWRAGKRENVRRAMPQSSLCLVAKYAVTPGIHAVFAHNDRPIRQIQMWTCTRVSRTHQCHMPHMFQGASHACSLGGRRRAGEVRLGESGQT